MGRLSGCVALVRQVALLKAEALKLREENSRLSSEKHKLEKALAARTLRLETMEELRKKCDEVEALVPPSMWTLGTYKELLFLDANQGAEIVDIE